MKNRDLISRYQLKVPADSGNGMVQFRTLLINRCQKEFEKEKSDEQEEKVEREKIAQLPVSQSVSLSVRERRGPCQFPP